MFRLVETRCGGDSFLLAPVTEHVIYKAHFPGYPITPGVCILSLVGQLLALRLNTPMVLKEARNVKFVNAIFPDGATLIEVLFQKTVQTDADMIHVQGIIRGPEKVYCKFSLLYAEDVV